MTRRTTPSFKALKPASVGASAAARGSSRKRDTKCELVLRRALHRAGLRYRIARADLPGHPDVVFSKAHIAIFCDGDFWHGRRIEERLKKLSAGHNAHYWTEKIQRNLERDRRHDAELRSAGWTVLRFWESDILRDSEAIAKTVKRMVDDTKRASTTGQATSSRARPSAP